VRRQLWEAKARPEGGSATPGRGTSRRALESWPGKVPLPAFYTALLTGHFTFGPNATGSSHGRHTLLFGVLVYSIVFKIYFSSTRQQTTSQTPRPSASKYLLPCVHHIPRVQVHLEMGPSHSLADRVTPPSNLVP
jgi:hypothetical protein